MGLKVWLPLTKDLHNQGTSQVTVTNNGATYSSTGGKLGGCYNFSNKNIVIPSTSFKNEFTNNKATITAWMKVATSHSAYAQALVLGTQGTSWNNILFGIDINGSGTPIANASTGSAFTNLSFGTTVKDGVWHHFAYVYDAGIMKVYLDGVQKATTTTSNTPAWTNTTNLYVGGNSGGEIFQNNDSMCDVRLYNEALSPQEVAEIAKGLVLHYPLERRGLGQENLLSRYVTTGQTGPTNTANSGGQTNYYGDYGIIIPATNNADTYFRLFLKEQLVSGQQYTISCKVKGLKDGSYYYFPLFAQSNSAMGQLALTHNGLCSLTFTMNWTGTQTSQTTNISGETVYILFMDDTSRNIASGQGAIIVYDFKLEKGNKVTPFCPADTDPNYSTWGLNSNIEYDGSGFQNNGTRTGTFTWNSDTPSGGLYPVSTEFGSGKQITGAITTPNALSATVWIKDTGSLPNSAICFRDDISHLAMGIQSNNLICGASGGNEVAYISNFNSNQTYKIGQWNHIAIIKNNGSYDIYINGVKQTLSSPSSQWSAGNPTGCLVVGGRGGSDYWPGKLSDLRIYTTALSENDIKSLYQNEAFIDTNGTVYGAIR